MEAVGNKQKYNTNREGHPMSHLKLSVRVAIAVRCVAQHTTPCSTEQHTCMLLHNATTGIIHIPSVVPAAIGGQLGQLGTTCIVWSETALLGLNN